jgi:outer membrane protein
VDLDTVLSRYNLAKDYNEEMLRMQNNMESALKRHESNIQGFANSMQKKMQNNGYLSEASYKQDQDKIASMQNSAQRDAANLQNNFQNAAMKAQQTVNDSIEAFIKEYNAKRGYDAILFKAATLYINPELDITDEVVEGLNARYNKVKK